MNGSDALMTGAVFLLMAAAFAVLFGTLYPLGYEVFAGRTLTVGAPYFNNFFAPMTLIAAALAGAAQLGLRNRSRRAVTARRPPSPQARLPRSSPTRARPS